MNVFNQIPVNKFSPHGWAHRQTERVRMAEWKIYRDWIDTILMQSLQQCVVTLSIESVYLYVCVMSDSRSSSTWFFFFSIGKRVPLSRSKWMKWREKERKKKKRNYKQKQNDKSQHTHTFAKRENCSQIG